MSKYHGRIMNIKAVPESDYDYFGSKALAYKEGHRDARHEAAEIVLEAEGVINDLLEALEGLWGVVEGAIQSGDWQVDGACDPDAELHRAERVIKKAKGAE